MNDAHRHKSATGHEIHEILGTVDEETITEVLRIGASQNEVMQAFEWLEDDDYMGAELENR